MSRATRLLTLPFWLPSWLPFWQVKRVLWHAFDRPVGMSVGVGVARRAGWAE